MHARIGRLEKLTFWGRAAAAWPFEAGERASRFSRAAALRNLSIAFGLRFTTPSGVRSTPFTRRGPPPGGPLPFKVLRIRFRMDGSDSQVCASQTQVIGGSRERSRQASASTRWEATGFLAAIQSAPDLSVLPRRIFEDRFVGSLCGSTNTSKCPENASQDTFGCTGADPTKRSHPSLLR